MKPYQVVLDKNRKNVIVIETTEATDELAQMFADWIQEHNLGTRIAFLMWRMRNEEAITLFLMKWA